MLTDAVAKLMLCGAGVHEVHKGRLHPNISPFQISVSIQREPHRCKYRREYVVR